MNIFSCLSKLRLKNFTFIKILYTFYYKNRVKKSFDSELNIGKQTLIMLLREDPTIIEIGAHHGYDTAELACAFKKGQIIAFEAHPKNFYHAFGVTKYFPNVKLFPFAVAEKSGIYHFNQSSGNSTGAGSILKPDKVLVRNPKVLFLKEDVLPVAAVTLDEVLGELNIFEVDLIWIDAQGAEEMIFKSAIKTLKRTKFIYTEVSEISGYVDGANYKNLRNFLQSLNFYPVLEFLPSDSPEGNVLFRNKSDLLRLTTIPRK